MVWEKEKDFFSEAEYVITTRNITNYRQSKRGPSLPMVAEDRRASSHVWLTIIGYPGGGFYGSVHSKGDEVVCLIQIASVESTGLTETAIL